MLLNVYLIGWLVTAIGVGVALVAADRLCDRRRSRLLSVGSLAAFAGAMWPVLVVGVVEMLAFKAVVETMRAAHPERGPLGDVGQWSAYEDGTAVGVMAAATSRLNLVE